MIIEKIKYTFIDYVFPFASKFVPQFFQNAQFCTSCLDECWDKLNWGFEI